MFNKNKKDIYNEIDINKLKSLKLFESVDGNFNEIGFSIVYTRIPGGLVRLVINTEAIDQLFIPLNASWFNLSY